MDYVKMIRWVNENRAIAVPAYIINVGTFWIVDNGSILVVMLTDKCSTWEEAVNLAMIRS